MSTPTFRTPTALIQLHNVLASLIGYPPVLHKLVTRRLEGRTYRA